MPIYEYRCTLCGHELEALQKFSDSPLTGCPSCNNDGLVKLVSAAGFQLKGSGWYATDFKGSGRKAPDSKTDGKTDSKTDSKTDGKPAGETKAGTGAESKAATSTESPKPAGGCGSGCACH